MYVKQIQAQHFIEEKENLSEGKLLVHMDFSQNYVFQYQDEIQSAHWNSNSCTLYTAILYYKDTSGKLNSTSYIVVSNYMQHDKYAVAVFNEAVIEDFKNTQKDMFSLASVEFQSDGPAQHFKQKFSLSFMTLNSVPTAWNFSATSHGKGAIDGLGGIAKRRV